MGRSAMAKRLLCLVALVSVAMVSCDSAFSLNADDDAVTQLQESSLPKEVDGIKVSDLRKAVRSAVVKAVAKKKANGAKTENMVAKVANNPKALKKMEKKAVKKAEKKAAKKAEKKAVKKAVKKAAKKAEKKDVKKAMKGSMPSVKAAKSTNKAVKVATKVFKAATKSETPGNEKEKTKLVAKATTVVKKAATQ